jgi:hypothetical protein
MSRLLLLLLLTGCQPFLQIPPQCGVDESPYICSPDKAPK